MKIVSTQIHKAQIAAVLFAILVLAQVAILVNFRQSYSAQPATPLLQGQTKRVYLPFIVRSISEIDIACRWPHTTGNYTYIPYKWGNNLQTTGSLYRNAFESSITDWNGIATKMRLTSSSTGNVEFNTYNSQDNRGGVTYSTCNGAVLTRAQVLANIYYESGRTVNSRRALTGHETGHGLGLGHIPESEGIALMGYNPDANIYYVPQSLDAALMNQVYP